MWRAAQKAGADRAQGKTLPGKKLMKQKRRRRGFIGPRKIESFSEGCSRGSQVYKGGSQRFWQRDFWERKEDESRKRAKKAADEQKRRVNVELD